ncbi:MAG: 2-phospho-L-lactate guanylyltransferase [Rhizorhabdus sp.]|jgi:2-phospho-L-lactate guanylyltransferase|uniref:2-phospho-L-lactate guanylyltransferase n=1 Tax=Rhizorhabdus sp. TaxID=1968843 RepID=UPI001B5F18A5|nr:2-phospho-L-lactate guanylyltransferase [Rhizorhabdus sp.]MBP8234444.1 2-phospho-L-lactate guanylyltransferase [Rhizorhabdus sp.]
MKNICILAARSPQEGKSRLSLDLSLSERYALNMSMFHHVLKTVCELFEPDEVVLVTRSSEFAEIASTLGIQTIEDRGDDLNAAFAQGRKHAMQMGAERLVTLSCDLPYLEAADLAALMATRNEVAIAPDRHGTGTNALVLCPPLAIDFSYGPDSYRTHLISALSEGRTVSVVDRPGLAKDIDLPAELRELLGGQV